MNKFIEIVSEKYKIDSVELYEVYRVSIESSSDLLSSMVSMSLCEVEDLDLKSVYPEYVALKESNSKKVEVTDLKRLKNELKKESDLLKKASEKALLNEKKDLEKALLKEQKDLLKQQKEAEKDLLKEQKEAEKLKKEAEKAEKDLLKQQKEADKALLKEQKEAVVVVPEVLVKVKVVVSKEEKKALALKEKEAKNEEKLKEKEAKNALKKDLLKEQKVSKKVSKKDLSSVVAAVVEEEVEEEADVVKRIEFEGVKYLKSKNTGIIYNMEQDVVGKWNDATQKIDFNPATDEEVEEEYEDE